MTSALQDSSRRSTRSCAEGESSDVPALVSPLQDTVVDGATVTLKFEPLQGYSGPYMVRLSDTHWNGRQAPGFTHDTNQHYLSIATTSTQITVPVEPGEVYGWWVHKPGYPAAGARFSVGPGPVAPPTPPPPAPTPNVPTLVSPLQNEVIEGTSATLKFEPLPGYSGPYMVRLTTRTGTVNRRPDSRMTPTSIISRSPRRAHKSPCRWNRARCTAGGCTNPAFPRPGEVLRSRQALFLRRRRLRPHQPPMFRRWSAHCRTM